ncbi:response regulator transcription factor [Ramlibacter sp.]|uniref:response regulator transcription factor n=1 Tax=Ramlibacter sp. TaxID=1917967 RepID=UPI002FC591C5
MMPATPPAVRVVLAEDHDLVRAGIRALLTSIPGVQVLADVSDGKELLAVLESVQPDVAITDLAMPGMDGMTAIGLIRQRFPRMRVLVLSMQDSVETIKRAVACGAAGYLRKNAQAFELAAALHSLMANGSYFEGGIARRLLEPAEPGVRDLLTERQVEILTLLASGKASKEIAFELGLSSKTVDVHRSRIMERLGLNDVASLTLYAVRQGLVQV